MVAANQGACKVFSMTSELSQLLDPQSVAIIGVSENPARIGGRLFKYLTKHGYKGHLALVNPKYQELNGVACYPSVSDIPVQIDCALIAVPEKYVLSVLSECADSKVGSAVIFSSGFAEVGEKGKDQREGQDIGHDDAGHPDAGRDGQLLDHTDRNEGDRLKADSVG